MTTWADVYAQVGVTREDVRFFRICAKSEREERMCSIVEASSLIEFEQPCRNHCRVIKKAIDHGETGVWYNTDDARQIHKQLFPYGGTFRTHDVRISHSNHRPVPYHLLRIELYKFDSDIEWWLHSGQDPYTILSHLHFRFCQIHPFTDGNGRVSRILLNNWSAYLGVGLVRIPAEEREYYIDLLESQNVPALAKFIKECRV